MNIYILHKIKIYVMHEFKGFQPILKAFIKVQML